MRFLSKLFKHWYLYVLLLLIFPAVATVYAKKTLSVYESTALLLFSGQTDGSGSFVSYLTPAQNGANAMGQALQIETFCVSVAQDAGLATQYDLNSQAGQGAATARIQSEITIAPAAVGPNLVSVTVDDKNPLLAKQIADAFVKEFHDYSATLQIQFDNQQIAQDQGQLNSLKAQLKQDQAQLAEYYTAHPSCVNNTSCTTTDPTLNGYLDAITQDTQAISGLTTKLDALNLDKDNLTSGSAGLYTEVDYPQPPLSTTLHLKKLIVYPIAGFAAALALILLIVGIQTFLDRRVYSTQDLKSLAEDMDLNIPAIESVPVLRGIGRPSSQDDDADGSLNGILVPVLTVLPQLGSGQMTQELRRAIGVTVEDEE